MITVTNDNFDLDQICESGQCFRMSRFDEGTYRVISDDKILYLSQERNEIRFFCPEEEYEGYWKHYFDLETDYGRFIKAIDPADNYMVEAAASCSGMRILNQNLWEMIVTFLISQQNNIKRITKCVENICAAYGEKIVVEPNRELKEALPLVPEKIEYHAFPKPEAMCDLEDDALMACNLGYRSKYVVRAAKTVVSGEYVLDDLWDLDYDESMAKLKELCGVGDKVANCICLFALHHIDAFPIDTHIKQILAAHYPGGFPFSRYQGFCGVMQQYMFYHKILGNCETLR